MTESTRKQIRRFKQQKRAYFSLILITVGFVLSLGAELICNNKPIVLKWDGNYYFPIFKYYPAKLFGDKVSIEADYKKVIASDDLFEKNPERWALFPIVPFGVNESIRGDSPPPHAPNSKNWLGTDDRGRDLLTRIIYGFRISMVFALIAWAVTSLFGFTVGAIQGYLGGKIDLFGQRLIEIWTALPFFYVVVFLMNRFPPSLILLVGVWVVFSWMSMAGFVRAEVLRVRKLDYIQAAQALGAGHGRILFVHILRNTTTPILTLSPFLISAAISGLAALDYLGLGLPEPTASWGELLRQGKENLTSWWLVIYPFLALFITVLLVNFVGEGIRNALAVREEL